MFWIYSRCKIIRHLYRVIQFMSKCASNEDFWFCYALDEEERADCLYFIACLLHVLWMLLFCGSYSGCRGLVCSVWLWYFLRKLTCIFLYPVVSVAAIFLYMSIHIEDLTWVLMYNSITLSAAKHFITFHNEFDTFNTTWALKFVFIFHMTSK